MNVESFIGVFSVTFLIFWLFWIISDLFCYKKRLIPSGTGVEIKIKKKYFFKYKLPNYHLPNYLLSPNPRNFRIAIVTLPILINMIFNNLVTNSPNHHFLAVRTICAFPIMPRYISDISIMDSRILCNIISNFQRLCWSWR